jgi:hypothetical protein
MTVDRRKMDIEQGEKVKKVRINPGTAISVQIPRHGMNVPSSFRKRSLPI